MPIATSCLGDASASRILSTMHHEENTLLELSFARVKLYITFSD